MAREDKVKQVDAQGQHNVADEAAEEKTQTDQAAIAEKQWFVIHTYSG